MQTTIHRAIATVTFAKLNLGLQVLYKRPDGYHEINTLFLRLSLTDELIVEAYPGAAEITVHCQSAPTTTPEENLVYKAAMLIKREDPTNVGLSIALHKHIPTGAGLGGGSSNAASALFACRYVLQQTIPQTTMMDFATQLGSDVPFFMLNGSTAHARGRGEIVTPLPALLPYWIVLVQPNVAVNTGGAYQWLQRPTAPHREPADYPALLAQAIQQPELFPFVFSNDFEPFVFYRYPEIEAIKRRLYEYNALYAQMTGSGSCVYGFFSSEHEAQQALQQFVSAKTFLTRHC